MTAPPVCVETDLDLHALSVDGLAYRHPRRTPAVLRWTAADPWAVTLAFTGTVSERNGDEITWAIGWELLTTALDHDQAGGWDVTLARLDDRYLLALASRDGSATFEIDPFDLVAFVEAVRPRWARAAATARAEGHLELRALLDGTTEGDTR